MRVIVLGDLHGDTLAGLDVIHRAKELGIAHIIACGDFGYWPHYRDGVEFLDALNFTLRRDDINLYWLDGNHENFDQIEHDVKHSPNDGHGKVWTRSHIRYCSRGATWKWNGKRFMTVGGAVSVDKEHRLRREAQSGSPRTLWWPQEQLTDAELDFAIKQAQKRTQPVDYLFTHDCPTNAPFRGRLKEDLDSQQHRQKMDRLGKALSPTLWFHGHMHTRYDGYDFPTYEPTSKVYGLECNPGAMHGYGTRSYWGVLDTDTDEFTYHNDLVSRNYQYDDSPVKDDF